VSHVCEYTHVDMDCQGQTGGTLRPPIGSNPN
jgi:hypothetical protein